MAIYRSAAICRRGHVITAAIRDGVQERCHICGSRVLIACEQCAQRIRGLPERVSGGFKAPDFCDACGAPHPWLSRQGRIYLLENLLDEEALDPAVELEVREQLHALKSPELDEDEQRRRWGKVQELAPGFWEKSGVKAILESVVSAGIKGALGL